MEKYNKYKIPLSSKLESMDEICNKKIKYELLPQQQFLAEYLFDNQNINGLLVYHQIGSGKTCTAISICEKFKNILKIIVVTPASLINNFRNELRSSFVDNIYISNKNKDKLKKIEPSNSEYINIIRESNKLIDISYNIYSYQKFIKLVNTPVNETGEIFTLDNTLLIIDEIQNMISLSGVFYNSLKYIINKISKKSIIILLTATPMMDNPNEIALLLNLLRPTKLFPIDKDFNNYFLNKNKQIKNIDEFKTMCSGLISYFRGDLPITFPKMNLQVLRCNMSDFQYNIYKLAIRKEKKKNKKIELFDEENFISLSANFYIGARITSNITFPNGKTGNEGFLSINESFDNMKEYSIKFPIIYKKVKKSEGTIFIYSQFLDIGGLKSLIKYFEYKGFSNYNNSNKVSYKTFAIWSGDISNEKKENIKTIFNKYENRDGSLIKILFGSPAAKEGISLLRVSQVHILEPYWNMSRITQIIGRAIRYCSHKDMPLDKRQVDVFIYLATYHNANTIDEYIWNMAKKKSYVINQFEHALKEIAIDCNIFYNRNNYPSDNLKIICNNI